MLRSREGRPALPCPSTSSDARCRAQRRTCSTRGSEACCCLLVSGVSDPGCSNQCCQALTLQGEIHDDYLGIVAAVQAIAGNGCGCLDHVADAGIMEDAPAAPLGRSEYMLSTNTFADLLDCTKRRSSSRPLESPRLRSRTTRSGCSRVPQF
jgi:hypothetical protein